MKSIEFTLPLPAEITLEDLKAIEGFVCNHVLDKKEKMNERPPYSPNDLKNLHQGAFFTIRINAFECTLAYASHAKNKYELNVSISSKTVTAHPREAHAVEDAIRGYFDVR